MGYPTFKYTGYTDSETGNNYFNLTKGIINPYSPDDLDLNQSRGFSRGGTAPYVTQWGSPTRFMTISIKNISSDTRQKLYDFFESVDYSLNTFTFYPFGMEQAEGEIFDADFFDDFFAVDVVDDEKFIARLWQDNLNIPYKRGITLADLDDLTLLIEEEKS